MTTKATQLPDANSIGVKTVRKKPVNKDVLLAAVQYLGSFHPIDKDTIQFLSTKLVERKLKKGEMLQHAGLIGSDIHFVLKGILRGFIIDNKKQVTTWITEENHLIASIRSFLLQLPTLENIEALEDSLLVSLHYSDLQELYEKFPQFNALGRKIVEYYYAYAEDRAFICRLSNASQRYDYFMKDNSHLVNRIPLMYIASYLGMSIETMSRIRSKLTKKKK